MCMCAHDAANQRLALLTSHSLLLQQPAQDGSSQQG